MSKACGFLNSETYLKESHEMDKQMKRENMSEPHQDLIQLEEKYIRIKSISLIIVAIVAVIFMLDWAQGFFIPLILGIFMAYILNPLVVWLEEIRIPRVVGSSVVILALMTCVSFGGISLSRQVESILTQLPIVAKKLTALVTTKKGEPLSNIQKVQIAASQVEKAASANDNALQKGGPMQVVVKEQKFKLSDFLWRGSLGFAGAVGQFVTIVFLAYFLLISGDTFKRKLVKLTGPTLTNKKITINILQDTNQSIQRYMFMLLVTTAMIALLMWVALRMFGLENAGAWAVASGLIQLVPYFGPIATAVATGLAAFIQFNSISMAIAVAGVSLVIAAIVGEFITTWMTGRIAKMNSPAIFVSLMFFTWLWGFWGMLLGIPIIVITKVISGHIEYLQPVAEILGE
jgi:predicted PurR-regulated permease PerM